MNKPNTLFSLLVLILIAAFSLNGAPAPPPPASGDALYPVTPADRPIVENHITAEVVPRLHNGDKGYDSEQNDLDHLFPWAALQPRNDDPAALLPAGRPSSGRCARHVFFPQNKARPRAPPPLFA